MARRLGSVALSFEQLLEGVEHLSPAELREFQEQLTAWQHQNGKGADEDAALLRTAKTRLPATMERRLRRLIAKSERGTLTAKELADYQTLAQRAERINVIRAEALAQLVRRRGKPAPDEKAERGEEGGPDGNLRRALRTIGEHPPD